MASPKCKLEMEKQLVVALTEACEVAKSEIRLTHDNDHQEFPSGLRITWIFDNHGNLDHALANGENQRMRETQWALEEVGIESRLVSDCLQFASEEPCFKTHGRVHY